MKWISVCFLIFFFIGSVSAKDDTSSQRNTSLNLKIKNQSGTLRDVVFERDTASLDNLVSDSYQDMKAYAKEYSKSKDVINKEKQSALLGKRNPQSVDYGDYEIHWNRLSDEHKKKVVKTKTSNVTL